MVETPRGRAPVASLWVTGGNDNLSNTVCAVVAVSGDGYLIRTVDVENVSAGPGYRRREINEQLLRPAKNAVIAKEEVSEAISSRVARMQSVIEVGVGGLDDERRHRCALFSNDRESSITTAEAHAEMRLKLVGDGHPLDWDCAVQGLEVEHCSETRPSKGQYDDGRELCFSFHGF